MTNRKMDGTHQDEYPGSICTGKPQNPFSGSAGYEIRVKDHLDTYWYEWFEGWSITNLENGEVLLQSCKVDQAKLHGTLIKIRDLNLTLLSVTCVPTNG